MIMEAIKEHIEKLKEQGWNLIDYQDCTISFDKKKKHVISQKLTIQLNHPELGVTTYSVPYSETENGVFDFLVEVFGRGTVLNALIA